MFQIGIQCFLAFLVSLSLRQMAWESFCHPLRLVGTGTLDCLPASAPDMSPQPNATCDYVRDVWSWFLMLFSWRLQMPKCSLFVWLLYQRHRRRNYVIFCEGRIFSYSLIWYEVHAFEGACQPMLMKAKARSLTVLCKVAIVVLIVSKAAAQEDFALKRIRRLQLHAPVQSRSLMITLIFL